MHLGMTKCRIPQLGHYELELDLYDLVSRNCNESGANLLFSLSKEFQIWCLNAYWDDRVSYIMFGSL